MNEMLRGTFDGNSAQRADDAKVMAEFYTRSVVDGAASRDAGRPIHRDITNVKITQPGEGRLSVYDQPATDEDVARFPRQWQQYKAGQAQEVVGSPLTLLFPDNPAIVANLKFMSVFTVEQLAELPDTALQNVGMGARAWQEKAKAYLAKAEGGQGFHALAAKVEAMELKEREKDDRIAALEAALAEATDKKRTKAA